MPEVKSLKSVNGSPTSERRQGGSASAKGPEKIAPDLVALAVDIDSLVHDPLNARLHPEINLEAIKLSLTNYGQLRPIVARRSTRVIVAGNGTVTAARALGWRRIAATLVDLNDVEAAGYGLADNRTAELAKWDHAVVAILVKMMEEQGQSPVGWTRDELENLRRNDFVPPPDDFKDFGDGLDVEHVCPRCGYGFSGGEKRKGTGEPIPSGEQT